MATDVLDFLDASKSTEDPLSFLDEPIQKEDPLSFLDQPKEPSYFDMAVDYLKNSPYSPGAGARLQMKSGGFAGAPNLTPEQAAKVATEVATIAAVETVFAPVIGAAAASTYVPKLLTAVARLTQAGTTGAAVATTSSLVEKGDLPEPEELIEHGSMWVAIDLALQGLHLTFGAGKTAYDFGKAVSDIAEKEGVPKSAVLNKLWESTKNWAKSKMGRTIETPADVTIEDAKQLVNEAKKAEKEIEIPVKAEEIERNIVQTQDKEIEIPKKLYHVTEENIEGKLKKGKKGLIFYAISKDDSAIKHGLEREGAKLVEEKPEINKVYVTKELTLDSFDENFINNLIQEGYDAIYDHEKGHIAYFGKDREKLSKEDLEKIDKKRLITSVKRSELINEDVKKELLEKIKKGEIKTAQQVNDYVKDKKEKETPKAEEPLTKKFNKRPQEPRLEPRKPVIGKKQAVARSKIIKTFKDAFDHPIKLGKISNKKAAGIHKMWSKVTRLLKDNDIETAAHEIGHNLHTTLYEGAAKTPAEQAANVNKALRPYLDELKPLALYEPYGMEGFAEFTRLYVTNPDVAKDVAPQFYAKFEADLEAQQPKLKNALLQAREYYEDYLQGTPESRIDAQTSYAQDMTKVNNLVEWVKDKTRLDKLKTDWLDDIFPAKRVVAEAFDIPLTEVENLKDERNLYRSLRILKGAIGKADVFLGFETFNAKTLDKTGEGLRSILKELPDEKSYKEFNRYLIARRVIEKTGQKIETGINIGDAIEVHKQLKSQYEKLAIRLDKYNDSLLQYAHDSGLLSSEQYASIKKNNLMYVPFQRVMEKDKGGKAATGGRLQAGKPVKRMKGSTRDIVAPLESIIKNTYSIIVNSEKNLSGQVLAKLAQMKGVGAYVERVPTPMEIKGKISKEQIIEGIEKKLPNWNASQIAELEKVLPDFFMRFGTGTYPAGENIITVFENGKPTFYEVSPDLYKMWNEGIAPYTANIITKILRIPARTLRAGAILNPKFIQKNFIRDTWGGVLFTKYGKSIKDPVGLFIDTLYTPLAQLATAAKQSGLYVEWMKSGGGMSTMQSLDRDNVYKKLKEVRDGLKPHQVIKWLRKVAEISEEGNRLAEFGRALEVEGKTRLGREIAAFAARDLSIDFAKMGLQAKALNQIIPFFNATIQGGDKLIRMLGSAKDRAEFIARVVAFIVVPSLMFAWLNKDDDRVKEMQDQEQDFNFITFIGDVALKIPVPFETGVIAHGLTQRLYRYMMKKDPEAFEGFMGSIFDAMKPSFIPAIANPLIETYANKNFFTGGRIIPAGKEDLISKYQYRNNTSSTARLLARAAAYMLGQDTRSKAASPAIIDHFINSWTGGLGRLMINISDASLEAAGLSDKVQGPTQTVTEKLGLDAFIARYPRSNTKSIEKFYDLYGDATARQKSFKYAEKMELESEEAIGEAYERFDKIYDYKTLQRAYKAIQASQKEINNIWNDPTIDPDEKKVLIDQLYLQQVSFAQFANEDIREYRLAQKD